MSEGRGGVEQTRGSTWHTGGLPWLELGTRRLHGGPAGTAAGARTYFREKTKLWIPAFN